MVGVKNTDHSGTQRRSISCCHRTDRLFRCPVPSSRLGRWNVWPDGNRDAVFVGLPARVASGWNRFLGRSMWADEVVLTANWADWQAMRRPRHFVEELAPPQESCIGGGRAGEFNLNVPSLATRRATAAVRKRSGALHFDKYSRAIAGRRPIWP